MKKILLSLLLLPLAGMAQQKFTINGEMKPQAGPVKALLYYTVNGKNVVDSTIVKNGAFTFTGTIPDYTTGNIKIKHPPVQVKSTRRPETDMIQFMLEPGTLRFVSKSDSIKSAKVSGAEVADAKAKCEALGEMINAKAKAFMEPFNAAPLEKKREQAFVEPFQRKMEEFKAETDNIQRDFARDNPDNYYSLLVYAQLISSRFDRAGTEALFNTFSPRLKATALGQQVQLQINEAKAFVIGETAPDFTQNDVNDKPVKLSDFKGKYVLVDFWASWCVPCRSENIRIKHMYNLYKDKNFTIIGVSMDNPGQKDAWLKAIKDDGLTWTNVSDLKGTNNEVARKYFVQSIPNNVLVGPDGKVLGRNLRGANLTKRLAEILAN